MDLTLLSLSIKFFELGVLSLSPSLFVCVCVCVCACACACVCVFECIFEQVHAEINV